MGEIRFPQYVVVLCAFSTPGVALPPCSNSVPEKSFTTVPVRLNLRIGSRSESRQSRPAWFGSLAAHRMMTHRCRPSGSIFKSPTAPGGLPSGNWAQPSTMRYGFGTDWAEVVIPVARNRTMARGTINPPKKASKRCVQKRRSG